MCSAISIATCFRFFPGNFGFLHDAFEKFVVEEWKGLEPAPRSILRVPAPGFYMNPEQQIELVLRVLSTQPTDEVILRLEHEDVNPRKVEQEPEEKPEQEPEEEPEKEPEEKPEEEPEEEPVPLPVPVGGTLSTVTPQSLSFKKFRTHETTSSAPQRNGRLQRPPIEECWCVDHSRLKCKGCAQCVRLGEGSWAVDFGPSFLLLIPITLCELRA
jgi:hypothetical protein